MARIALIGDRDRLRGAARTLSGGRVEVVHASDLAGAGGADVAIVDLPSGARSLMAQESRPKGLRRMIALGDVDSSHERRASFADAILWRPVSARALRVAAGLRRPQQAPRSDIEQLFELSALSLGTGTDLASIGSQLAEVFDVSQAIVALDAGRDRFCGAIERTMLPSEWATLDRRLDAVSKTTTTVIMSVPTVPGHVQSYLAAPLASPERDREGIVCLIADEPRVFSPRERRGLAALARRLSLELVWSGLYERLVAEFDRIRDAPLMDPRFEVWNRPALERLLHQQIAGARRFGAPLTVALVDVVGLQRINREHGIAAGDRVLQAVAGALRQEVRESDVVAHYRDDEFAVVYPGTPAPAAQAAVERIQRRVAQEPVRGPGDASIDVEVTAGITGWLPDDDSINAVLERASRALRHARRDGRSVAIADPDQPASGRFTARRHDVVEPSTTLGGTYRLLHEISRGGMGVIYRAEDIGLGRPVAVKMMRSDLAGDRELLARFRAEAAILAKLRHPNLVEVYAFGVEGDDAYFVMDLVEGRSLTDQVSELRQGGRRGDLTMVKSVVRQIASALDALHVLGIIHRDVKPDNIVLDPFRDRAVLVDVGIAHRHGERAAPAGTPGYIAPELLDGLAASAQSDIYGLAATAYTMIALEPPWGETGGVTQVLERQRTTSPKPLADVDPQLAAIDDVLRGALSLHPSERPASASGFARAFAAAVDGTCEPTTDPPSGPVVVPELTPRVAPRSETTGPCTRGIVFRSIARVIGVRVAHEWRDGLAVERPDLAAALSTDLEPMDWHPTSLLVELLGAATAAGRAPSELGADLGRATVRGSFRRLFPASAATLAPAPTLDAFGSIWRRYHRWGEVAVMPMDSNVMGVRMHDTLRSAPLCAWTLGALEQLVTLAGGDDVAVQHDECEATGADACTFRVAWTGADAP